MDERRKQIAERRKRVAELAREGRSTRDIGEEVGVSHETVSQDIRAVEETTGQSLTDHVLGRDGKLYLPKAAPYLRDYETEPGFGGAAAEKTAGDHLADAVNALARAKAALQAGYRQPDVPELLKEIREVLLPEIRKAHNALPKAPSG